MTHFIYRLCKYIILVTLIFSCTKEYSDPMSVDQKSYPESPYNLNARVNDKSIQLNWSQSDSQSVEKYLIFKKDTLSTIFTVIDSIETHKYTDADVKNGMLYAYKVSALGTNGFTGPFSETVYAKPGTYSIIINQGRPVTTSRDVTLNIVGTPKTKYIKVSNEPFLDNISFENFVSTKLWQLSERDGLKTVYVQFRDSDNNDTFGQIYDTIILDTQAEITDVRIEDKKSVYVQGDTIKLVMVTNEPDGNASVQIGSQLDNIRLYDDKTHGDAVANDGIYFTNYITPQNDVVDAMLTGYFKDPHGNTAESFVSNDRVTIQNPPDAVRLFPPEIIENNKNSLHLFWSKNKNNDFVNYKIYRSQHDKVDSNSNLIGISHDQNQNVFIDDSLLNDRWYYYRIYVTDLQGLSSGSNIVGKKTGSNDLPQPVKLNVPVVNGQHTISISWEQCNDQNFQSYRLYRSNQPEMTYEQIPVFITQERGQTFFTDDGLESGTTYYYRIFIFDLKGQAAGSNTRSAKTLENQPPEPVTLAQPIALLPGTLRLTWSRFREDDFDSYRLYRSRTSSINFDQAPIAVINNPDTNSFDDVGLESQAKYYYQIYVVDKDGLYSKSNMVDGFTQ